MASKVILIEDSRMLVQCLKLLLAPADVVAVSDLATAEALVRSASPTDTVMVDLKLPDSAPLATLCRIAAWKKRKDAPRVVVITGTKDQRIIDAAREGPADAVAVKNGEGFFAALRDLGLVPKPQRDCGQCSENVERIEKEVGELVGVGG